MGVDAVDLAILREMMSERTVLFGSFNPKISSEQVARRLNVDPSTVRARIRGWERQGFLEGFAILPNPRLFGAQVHACGLRIENPRMKAAALEQVALVDGVVSHIEHVGAWIGVGFVIDHPSVLDRRTKQLANIPGVDETEPFFEAELIAPTRQPSPLDWRILAAAHADPKATLSTLARRVGVSLSTLASHYQGLVSGHSVWSLPQLDFSRFDGGVLIRLIVVMDRGANIPGLAAAIAREFSEPFFLQSPDGLATADTLVADLLLHLPAVARIEDVQVLALSHPGVRDAEILYPRRYRVYTDWARERIAAHVGSPHRSLEVL